MKRTIVALAFIAWMGSSEAPKQAPWCGPARITGYVRGDGNPYTYDGTSIYTSEPIVAASWDIAMGSKVTIEGLGRFRVADRGMLGWSPWIDVAVWTEAEAYALTGTRNICVSREDQEES